jgi:hypothetical protein
MGTGSFLEVKRPECGVDHSALSSAEVKEILVIYPIPFWSFVARDLYLFHHFLWLTKKILTFRFLTNIIVGHAAGGTVG